MSEWEERGPFKVRVSAEASRREGSFREGAAPDRIVQIAWQDEPDERSGPHVLTIVGGALLFMSWVATSPHGDEPLLAGWVAIVLLILAMLTMSIGITKQMTKHPLRSRKEPESTEVRIDPHALRLTRGKTEHTFPKARVRISTREDHGRRQVVLQTEGDQLLILHDTHLDLEADWLAERLNEELAR